MRTAVPGAAIVLLALLAIGAPAAHAQPLIEIEPEQGRAMLTQLPAILDDPVVAHELGSGLTNTVVVEVTAEPEHGTEVRGGARIEIRYEPWDEVYLTRSVGVDRELHEASLDSEDALQGWWSDLGLCVLPAGALAGGSGWTFEVEARVLPFSSAEQHEAQVWFTRTASRTDPGRPDAAPEGDHHSRVLDVLVATSIRRSPLITYHWQAEMTEGDGATEDAE
jgi:hypothetical protein